MPAEPVLSIVGTRQADFHSASAARLFAAALAKAGFAVASGMAVGIDREAHLGALHAGGATIGVLANGIDVLYPSRNRDLFSAVLASGTSCLISEYPPGIMAGKWTFVRRNRIISGLARGTIVVKAGEKSGALITASCAAEQGREVFACPGPALDESYAGCHRLIRSGAVLAASPSDVLAEFGFTAGTETPALVRAGQSTARDSMEPGRPLPLEAFGEGTVERRILESISPPPVIDDLIRKLGLPAAEVHQALNMLELDGIIRKNGNVVAPA
jgi:DNA processing protein